MSDLKRKPKIEEYAVQGGHSVIVCPKCGLNSIKVQIAMADCYVHEVERLGEIPSENSGVRYTNMCTTERNDNAEEIR